jgi:hypothetical protein
LTTSFDVAAAKTAVMLNEKKGLIGSCAVGHDNIARGVNCQTNTLVQVPITVANAAQSFSLAAVNFTGNGKDTLFTGEPDGRVYSWTGNDATNPLQCQLFNDAYRCASELWQFRFDGKVEQRS